MLGSLSHFLTGLAGWSTERPRVMMQVDVNTFKRKGARVPSFSSLLFSSLLFSLSLFLGACQLSASFLGSRSLVSLSRFFFHLFLLPRGVSLGSGGVVELSE